MVLELVERRLRSMPGVKGVRYLTSGMRDEIGRLESTAESRGAIGGLMKFKNKGVWEVLEREECMLLVLAKDRGDDLAPESILSIVDQAGQVLGENISPERREDVLKERPGSFMITDDFVMHSGWRSEGEPYFLIDEIPIHALDDIEEVTRVTSGSLSVASDEFVRDIFGFGGPDEHTRLVGFDLDGLDRRP